MTEGAWRLNVSQARKTERLDGSPAVFICAPASEKLTGAASGIYATLSEMTFERFGLSLRKFLHHPARVLVVCLIFLCANLVFDGILWRLWGLRRDHERLTGEVLSIQREIGSLGRQLRQARDPSFIERQARDKLDLVGENDLVFVFPEE